MQTLTEPPPERAINYYQSLAKGGIGLIIVSSHVPFWPTTHPGRHTIMESDSMVPGWRRLVECIHEAGAKAFGQFIGPSTNYNVRGYGGGSILYASPTRKRNYFRMGRTDIPHEIDIDDIRRVAQAYGMAARRMKEAGYDGIEIEAIYGMFLAGFLSPYYNRRTDQYGGSIENRMRILLEIIDSIRENSGPDIILGVKYSGDELIEGGLTLEDGKEIAKRLEDTGKVDFLHTTDVGEGPQHVPSMYYPLGCNVYMSAGVKDVVDLQYFALAELMVRCLQRRYLPITKLTW